MAEVISVRFRGGAKNYYFDPRGLQVEPEQYVVVETAQGIEYVKCVEGNHQVDDESVVQPLRPVVRIATDNDHKAAAYNRRREREAFAICEKKIAAHKLEMKLVSVECNFEGNKIIFFFTAEGRVDFRELVKDLASVFSGPADIELCGRSASGTRRRCWGAWASAAGPCAAASSWTSSSPCPSRWPRPRT